MGGATCILCMTVLICLLSTTAASTSPANTNTTTTTQATPATTTTKETTTTTKSQSTETATQTTITETPSLGANCSSNSTWCNSTVGARCLDGKCVCEDRHFMKNNTTCLPETALKPLNLTVSDVTSTSASLTWFVNSSVQSLALNIMVSAEIGETTSTLPTGSCSLDNQTTSQNTAQKTAHCTGLVPGYLHNFTVRVAFNNASSIESTRQSLNPAIPGKINLQESSFAAPKVTLKWGKSDGRVELYNVTVRDPDNMVANITVPHINTTLQQIPLTNLSAGKNYSVNITAYSYSLASETRHDSFRTNTAVPGPPSHVNISNITENAMKVRWNATSAPNGDIAYHKVCSSYKIYSDEETLHGNCWNTTNGIVTELVVHGLSAGAYYKFVVFTVNDNYTSNASDPSVLQRTLLSVPGNVSNMTATPQNESISVTWYRPLKPNGDIIAYRIDWSPKKISAHCTVYLKLNTSIIQGNNTCDVDVTEPDNITENQHMMTYNIISLDPDTTYIINVTAYTIKGPGTVKTTEQMTSIAVPEKVTNVIATVLNATSVNVSWFIPSVNPGPVNYTVKTHDQILPHTVIPPCIVKDYNSSSCVVTGLQEFWVYNFEVTGKTVAGESPAEMSNNITTDPAAPSKILNYSVTVYNSPERCNAAMFTFDWTEPNLIDRNDNITEYIFTQSGGSYKRIYTDKSANPYRPENKHFTFDLDGLMPETKYTFLVYPVSRFDSVNNEITIPVNLSACAPPEWDNKTINNIKMSRRTITSVAVRVPHDLFDKNQQGIVKEMGLVIIPLNKDDKILHVENMEGWNNASSSQFTIKYKIILQPHHIESGEEIEIGVENPCSRSHCNGPLREGFSFKVAVYACTNHVSLLCTVSSAFGPYTTLPNEAAGSSTGWIIAVAILVVLGVVLGAFAFLWYRGVIDPKKWIRRPGQGGGGFTPIEEIRRNRPILIGRYPSVLQEMHKDTNLILAGQYDDINKLGQMYADRSTSDAAREESNTPKNRWVNILPFDHSRVKLQQIDDDDPTTDYINANYMPGFNNKREYIATQGPLPGTIDDFWRMVWEHNVSVIVMLTQCKEGNRVKCEKYWPDELREPKQYDEVVVNPVSISTLDKYNISIFNVSVNNDMRQVIHFHYLDFPDFSANVEYEHFINFVRTVRSHVPRDMKGPMVVHCSAGVGRTGTFIIIDRLNLYLNSPDFSEGDEVDIFDMVAEMRENRVAMVQTESQYIMIHDCFEKMLEDKKKSMEQTELQDNPYENVNKAFDPFPDVLYENVKSTQNTEL